MRQNRYALALACISAVFIALLPVSTFSFDVKRSDSPLAAKEFFRPELYVTLQNVSSAEILERLPNKEAWGRMMESLGPQASVFFDPRSGTPSGVVTSIPVIPGDGFGNRVTNEDVQRALGRRVESIDSRVVADLISKYVQRNKEAIGIDVAQMGPVRAAQPNLEQWHVRIPQVVNGVPVRHGHMVANISHGNLVLLGTEMWGNVKIDTRPTITADRAVELAWEFAGGKGTGDEIWQKPMLELVPFAPPEYKVGEGFGGPVGKGYGHYLVYSFGFKQKNEQAQWEVLVDAHKGHVISFEDKNHYDAKQIVGGAYPLTNTEICPTNDTCGVMQPAQPMPYANTGFAVPNNFTNAAGVYDYSSGTLTTTLAGKYVRITDTCGAVSGSSATGGLDLGGTNGQHDCTGSVAGNTPASRSAFYEVNKIMENARGWLPGNAWLTQQITSNVNIALTCNAFYSPSDGTINFYKQGGGCRNTGEIAAVFDHEWGHALDDNDTGGALSSSSEGYADIASILRLRASCVGFGFLWTTNPGCGQTADGTGFNYNESQTGTHCATDCSGVRDSDWAKHADGLPDTALGYVCTHCGSGSGPCGKQVHCAAAPSRQAAWDLATRDLQSAPFNYTREDAFNVSNRVFYHGSGNIGSWHACTCGGTADGCGATNAYMQWITADDDDGNLANGTPHMTAIYNAFNRHGIACNAPVAVNGGCAGGPTTAPVVTPAIGNNQISLSWTAVAGASAYRVLRTEGYARCDFGKSVIATVPGTSYTDNEVANDRPYYYVVQPIGTSGACEAPVSECLTATPQPCAGAVSVDRSLYNCSDVINLNLVDSDLTGAGTQNVEVTSSVEATPEIVTLTEAPPGSGKFAGTIATTSAPAAADGLISVADGGTVSVRYVDASFCGTPNVNVDRSAPVDCSGPVITNVRAENVTGNSAELKWDTNEVATSFTSYGQTPPPATTTPTNPALVTQHTVKITGLTECSPYVFSVGSTDPAANMAVADNGGSYYTFETGRNVNPTYSTADPDVPLPPTGTASATPAILTIDIAEDKPLIDVDVRLDATHSYVGDIIVSLRHPDGTMVTLINRRGGGGDNFVATVLDDEASGPVSGGAAPFTGSFIPDAPLSVLDGKSSLGTWQLQALDNVSGDSGFLTGFDLILVYPGESCGPDCDQDTVTRLSDTCASGGGGTANGYWDDGEEAVFQVDLENVGSLDLTNVSATLTPITAGVTLLDDTATYPNIPRATSVGSDSPYFTARLNEGFACGTPVEFNVTIYSDQGTFNDSFLAGSSGHSVPGGIGTAMDETFSGGIPAGWTIVDGGSGGGAASTWTSANPGARTATAPITTPFAIADSDNAGSGGATQDEERISPVIDLTGAATATLEFDQYFRWYSLGGSEKGDVDVRSSLTGGAWVNVLRNQNAASPNPDHKTIDITAQAAGAADVQLRFHYYDASFDWYWMIDNVKITHPQAASCTIVNCDIAEVPPGEVPHLQFDDRTSASWTSVPGATSYNLYRGADIELPKLYTVQNDSCLRYTSASVSGTNLTETPASGAFDWWLVRAANGSGEGSSGAGSAGPRTLNSTGICP